MPDATKGIPLPDLDRAEWFDVEVPADLERSRDWCRVTAHDDDLPQECVGLLVTHGGMIDTGCGKLPRLHPQSYGAKFERDARAFDKRVQAYNDARNAASAHPIASTWGADHSELRKGKAHPRSYGAEFPLTHFTAGQLTRTTKEDKAAWLARPLTYSTPAQSAEWKARHFEDLATRDERLHRSDLARRLFPKYHSELDARASRFSEAAD